MRLTVDLYLGPENGCSNPANQQLCDVVPSGVAQAEIDVFGSVGSGYWIDFLTTTFDPDAAAEQSLGITASPALIFIDEDKGAAVYKMTNITETRVREVARKLFPLEYSETSSTGYINEDGAEVSLPDILPRTGGTAFSLGWLPGNGNAGSGCPSWMPGIICRLPAVLSMLLIVALIFGGLMVYRSLR
jgi:hypothetical protein